MTENGTPTPIHGDLTPIDGGAVERRRDPAESLDAVLTAHERVKAAKWKARLKVWGPIIAVVLGGGTWAGIELKPAGAPPTLPSDLREDVKKLEKRSEQNEKQIRALGKVTIEGLDHLGKKFDAAHPSAAYVEKPPSLVEAEKVVEEQKTEDRLDEILKGVTGDTGE